MGIYGIGVDVALVSRFERSFARFGERLLTRAFHPTEIAELNVRPMTERASFLASRWAVKEATFKAFQRYRVRFPEIYTSRASRKRAAVLTPLFMTKNSKALRLQFTGETEALARRLRLVVEEVVALTRRGLLICSLEVIRVGTTCIDFARWRLRRGLCTAGTKGGRRNDVSLLASGFRSTSTLKLEDGESICLGTKSYPTAIRNASHGARADSRHEQGRAWQASATFENVKMIRWKPD
ncbi:hypothetical protein PsorP6_014296 [Peronosclerospora sorghi]|uniref:Uncharacterized protein n=1 Tax=Peronosclerospora sorghi TaxID=230839 RepID=A0ACC0VHS5_9STRA|nr:hypothetical protein PsorP6_014296 [Peronosclerospora sorghi]